MYCLADGGEGTAWILPPLLFSRRASAPGSSRIMVTLVRFII